MYSHDCPCSNCEELQIEQTGQTLVLGSIDATDVDSPRQTDVPVFPTFRPLILSDKALLDCRFRQFPPEVSELTFTNLFAWRRAFNFSIAACGAHVLIAMVRDGAFLLMDPIGPFAGKKEVIEHCLRTKPEEMKVEFIRLPESTARLFSEGASYVIEEDIANFDYVYRTADLAELRGRKLDGKRNLVRRFRETTAFDYQLLTESDIAEALTFEQEWCDIKGCAQSAGLSREREAMEEMLMNFRALGLTGGVIRVSGKIVGVTLAEQLNQTTSVIHIEKANCAFPGIYQALNMLFAQSECHGLPFINREQDLGIPGLRQAKESYHPHHMVKKYTLKKV